MRPPLLLLLLLIASATVKAQVTAPEPIAIASGFSIRNTTLPEKKEIRLASERWHITKNHLVTGGLVFMAGMAKGFNETLQFHWKEFHRQFPKANARWFNPAISYRNKYRNGDSKEGPKFFLSTTVLVAVTDQYHLNNFINRLSWGSALVIKIGEAKKPFKYYLKDLLYYGLCHQAGFAMSYYPFSKYKGK